VAGPDLSLGEESVGFWSVVMVGVNGHHRGAKKRTSWPYLLFKGRIMGWGGGCTQISERHRYSGKESDC